MNADTLIRDELSSDEKVRAEYEMRQKAWRDRQSQMYDSFNEGIEKSRKEIERNALMEGATIEFVQKITGLDVETIKGFTKS